jgi:hypothetical protein
MLIEYRNKTIKPKIDFPKPETWNLEAGKKIWVFDKSFEFFPLIQKNLDIMSKEIGQLFGKRWSTF